MKNNLFELLARYDAYNIIGHVCPDGDSIGSQVALSEVVRALGKQCHIVENSAVPKNLSYFLKGVPSIPADGMDVSLPLICVDCMDYNRIGSVAGLHGREAFLNIDHHISNSWFAANNIVIDDASSTAEILAELLIGSKFTITKTMADALYLGIVTDSGRFSYPSTSLKTFKLAETLVGIGTSPSKIYTLVYENNTLERYRLLERFLKNIEIFCDGRLCLSFLREADFLETGASVLDTEGFVNYARELRGVLIGCFVDVRDDFMKCSLRAIDGSLRVDAFAGMFGGGGHQCAAGFSKTGVSSDFIEDIKTALCRHVEKFYDGYLASAG
jgi:phosphoesterase RecJ-like protein